jgi:uncharacterized membrane protein
VLEIAVAKLGFSPNIAFILLVLVIVTSTINILLYRLEASTQIADQFASGVLGTVIGADLLHLKDIQSMGAGVLSIGGARVFDDIALCGLFVLLLS